MVPNQGSICITETLNRSIGISISGATAIYPKLKSVFRKLLASFTFSEAILYCTSNFWISGRSEEHTSELQSRGHLVCRLLLEKKKKKPNPNSTEHQRHNGSQ